MNIIGKKTLGNADRFYRRIALVNKLDTMSGKFLNIELTHYLFSNFHQTTMGKFLILFSKTCSLK